MWTQMVLAKISFSFPGDRRGSEVLEELADCQNGEELVTSIQLLIAYCLFIALCTHACVSAYVSLAYSHLLNMQHIACSMHYAHLHVHLHVHVHLHMWSLAYCLFDAQMNSCVQAQVKMWLPVYVQACTNFHACTKIKPKLASHFVFTCCSQVGQCQYFANLHICKLRSRGIFIYARLAPMPINCNSGYLIIRYVTTWFVIVMFMLCY